MSTTAGFVINDRWFNSLVEGSVTVMQAGDTPSPRAKLGSLGPIAIHATPITPHRDVSPVLDTSALRDQVTDIPKCHRGRSAKHMQQQQLLLHIKRVLTVAGRLQVNP